MVPVVDLSRRGARFADEFAIAAARIARSGQFLFGAELDAFEREFAAWTGAGQAVAVSSGASALQLALAAVGVGAGDEVIIPAFTAVPTASAVMALGARPILADVDPHTATVSPHQVDAVRTAATRAVVVVHLYGYPADIPDLDIPVVEDAAQAHGALTRPGRSAATAYSFYPTKNLGGIGDGGAVVTDDHEVAERVALLRAHGAQQLYEHIAVSQNFRMSDLEAAWLRLGLRELDSDIGRRREIAATYRRRAPHWTWQTTHRQHGYHLCVAVTPERDRVRAELSARGVGTGVHYPRSIGQQPAYIHLAGNTPHADRWAAQCVSLPCFPEMTDDEVSAVADALAEVHP